MKNSKFYQYTICSVILLIAILLSSCKKYLTVDAPKNVVPTDAVFSNDGTASLAINGLYAALSSSTALSYKITQLSAFSADELSYFKPSATYDEVQANTLTITNADVNAIWTDLYKTIYNANSIIENAQASTGMSAAYKKQIIGEAKFFRAYCHFYLVNLYGPVPLITTTTVATNMYARRTSTDSVYMQIKADLTEAMNTLPSDYSAGSGERIRANKWAATALLARTYLYTKDWINAEAMASAVIGSGTCSLLPSASIGTVFKINSSEAILQLSRTPAAPTYEGAIFLQTINNASLLYFDHRLLPGLVNSFDANDLRKSNWILTKTYNNTGGTGTFSGPYKYQRGNSATTYDEYYMMLHLNEQYLIRAEAKAQQNNIIGAQADINIIRNRAGLANNVTIVDKATAMVSIESERRKELFCEWGHRWFDLKRWPSTTSSASKTRADDVIGALKPTTWKSSAIFFPIPYNAITNNPFLVQNDGY